MEERRKHRYKKFSNERRRFSKVRRRCVMFAAVCFWSSGYMLGSRVLSAAESHTPSWYEHTDIMQVVIALAIGGIVWNFKRGIDAFERSLRELSDDHKDMRKELDILQAEHNYRKAYGFPQCRHHPGVEKEPDDEN